MRLNLTPISPPVIFNTLQFATTFWAKNATCSDKLRINYWATKRSALSVWEGSSVDLTKCYPKQQTREDVP